jgi:hypothetical protein
LQQSHQRRRQKLPLSFFSFQTQKRRQC